MTSRSGDNVDSDDIRRQGKVTADLKKKKLNAEYIYICELMREKNVWMTSR